MATKWTEDEDQYLLKHSKSDVELLAKVLNRSTSAVRSRIYRVQRKAQENTYLDVEFGFFMDRANRALPKSTHELPKTAIASADLATWKGRSRKGGNAYRHTRTGYRADLGLVLRSSWEANVARVLTSYGIPFQFEPVVFTYPIKRGNKAYTPDFFLPATQEWIEVKGYFDDNSRIKMKRFKKYYPDEWAKLTMIISKSSKAARELCAELEVPVLFYQDIVKVFKDRISNWEG